MKPSVKDETIQIGSNKRPFRNSKRYLLGCIKDGGGDTSDGNALANGGALVDNGCVTVVVPSTPDDVNNRGHNEGTCRLVYKVTSLQALSYYASISA